MAKKEMSESIKKRFEVTVSNFALAHPKVPLDDVTDFMMDIITIYDDAIQDGLHELLVEKYSGGD